MRARAKTSTLLLSRIIPTTADRRSGITETARLTVQKFQNSGDSQKQDSQRKCQEPVQQCQPETEEFDDLPVQHHLFVACVIAQAGADDEDKNAIQRMSFGSVIFFIGAPFRKWTGNQTRSYSTTPSIMVRSTLRLVISMGSIFRISSERTIRSASLPTSTLPLRSSWKEA